MKAATSEPHSEGLMIGDYQFFMTPRMLEQIRQVNQTRNAGGPFVLALAEDRARGVAICELQSESRVIRNARFERRLGSSDWELVQP